jgi:uncharacterized membrane protein
MFCVKCGTENTDDSKFCRKCGQPLRQVREEAVQPSPASAPPPAAPVVVAAQAQAINPPPQATWAAPAPAAQAPVQPATAPATTGELGIQPNIAGALCYALGWVTGIVFLLIGGKNEFIRFNAWQSIIIFGFLSVLSIFFQIFSLFFRSLPLAFFIIYYLIMAVFGIFCFALWIFLMIRAYQSRLFKVPVAGNFAEQMMKKYPGK